MIVYDYGKRSVSLISEKYEFSNEFNIEKSFDRFRYMIAKDGKLESKFENFCTKHLINFDKENAKILKSIRKAEKINPIYKEYIDNNAIRIIVELRNKDVLKTFEEMRYTDEILNYFKNLKFLRKIILEDKKYIFTDRFDRFLPLKTLRDYSITPHFDEKSEWIKKVNEFTEILRKHNKDWARTEREEKEKRIELFLSPFSLEEEDLIYDILFYFENENKNSRTF